jgi:hypothetical protein
MNTDETAVIRTLVEERDALNLKIAVLRRRTQRRSDIKAAIVGLGDSLAKAEAELEGLNAE